MQVFSLEAAWYAICEVQGKSAGTTRQYVDSMISYEYREGNIGTNLYAELTSTNYKMMLDRLPPDHPMRSKEVSK